MKSGSFPSLRVKPELREGRDKKQRGDAGLFGEVFLMAKLSAACPVGACWMRPGHTSGGAGAGHEWAAMHRQRGDIGVLPALRRFS